LLRRPGHKPPFAANEIRISYNQRVKPSQLAVLRALTCTALVVLIVLVYVKWLHVNPTTVALTFLLAILFVAAAWGLRYSIAMSVAAALCLNFFFLPPVGTLTIADTQNWMALFAFFATSLIASNLSERARRQTAEAQERRQDIERLYSLSQQLLIAENVLELMNTIPHLVMETFGARDAAVYVSTRDQIYRSNAGRHEISAELLKNAARGAEFSDPAGTVAVFCLRMGARVVGAFGIAGEFPSRSTMEAAGSLIATAIERANAVDRLTRTEASREGERLRSALLDSVTHEFRTPLTAIKASVTTLRSGARLDNEQQQDLLAVIEEESDRLNRLIGEAVEMAQLDAKEVRLDLQPQQIREAIDAALAESRSALDDHPVEVRLPATLPAVMMDSGWIKKVLQHLLENAAKYSPAGSPIFVSSEVKNDRLITSVADRGTGIDDLERSMIFDKFYRGQSQRYRVQGTGMGLAIVKAIVEAHSGRIEVTSQLGHGSVFSFGLPLGAAQEKTS
jgi:two-component system, OmpR family, sensor histidine kinase KdpD